jgi:hypothetical protein
MGYHAHYLSATFRFRVGSRVGANFAAGNVGDFILAAFGLG